MFRADVPDLMWLIRPRGATVRKTELRGEAAVLDMADRMRACGGGSPATLYGKCVAEFRRGALSYDEVTSLYRHACVHARIVIRRDRDHRDCPHCGALLD